eukprot:259153_1
MARVSKLVEFNNVRSRLYKQAIQLFPNARREDIAVMNKYLAPQAGEQILGVGEGNIFFGPHISKSIGSNGIYIASDPSEFQIDSINQLCLPNVTTLIANAEDIELDDPVNKIWSFGAFHHCQNQEQAMKSLYKALVNDGKMVLCDVFRDTSLSEHFDGPVAYYCCTGHDVSFLGETYARTIVKKAGFKHFELIELPLQWHFDNILDIGQFIYNLHAMTNIDDEFKNDQEKYFKVLEGCQQILGIVQDNTGFHLNWPMKAIIAEK